MKSFAYYRLPYTTSYTKVSSDRCPLVLNDVNQVSKQKGFLIAPFHLAEDTPMVIIPPESIETKQIENGSAITGMPRRNEVNEPDESYTKAFTLFHDAITGGQFTKLVLARCKETRTNHLSLENLFLDLCHHYPRLMIMLFSTPLTGTWVIASPEILVEGKNGSYHTIALAGTMPYSDDGSEWSEKNKREQHIVEQYIEDIITPLSKEVMQEGPYTSRAGNLQHLRTDFHFHISDGYTIGNVISRLHPTPAICGVPTDAAKEFILTNEGLARRYYSGFAGPVGIDDETHLFVSLRCAELHEDTATLYAGGGILPDSECHSEWHETEDKMQTIADVL